MSIPVYDPQNPPKWFTLRNIKYYLRDSVVVNGEESNVYYAMISEITRCNGIRVQWYYLPHEMVMSRNEKASLHPNEIFITQTTDWIDVETIQMKAAIFHTKGFAVPKKIPDQWLILRRKYDPYKNTIKSIDLVKDDLNRVEKLNVSLCSRDSDSNSGTVDKTPPRKTPTTRKSTSKRETRNSTDPEIEVKFSKLLNIVSSSEDNVTQKNIQTPKVKPVINSKSSPVSLGLKSRASSTKSSYFFLSSEDWQDNFTQTNKQTAKVKQEINVKETRQGIAAPSSKTKAANISKTSTPSSTKPFTPSRGRSTRLTSELKTLSLSSDKKKSQNTPKVEKSKSDRRSARKQTSDQTPNRTRSGRTIKRVEHFHSLQQSMAIEALMRSNLLEAVSESDTDPEVSFKENKPLKSRKPRATPKSTKKKRRHRQLSSEESTDSNDEVKKKKTHSKTTRTPLAPKKLKPASVGTPCVIPLREVGHTNETSYTIARSRLHISAVPESLPCREEQFADIYYFLESKLEDKSGGCMYISGVPGTGKTATVRDVLKHIDDGDYDYQMIEINGMKLSDPKQLYSLIYRHLEGKKVTPDHGNLLLSEYFGKHEKKSIVLVVDELDLLWTRKQHVMYNLFDWPNRPGSKLVVIAIANTMDLPERMLMNKVASRLGLTRMTFQPYSHSQLLEIINSRLEGTTAFAPEACMLAARKVAAASGDARRALDICRHAIDVAEMAGADKVTSLHIQRAITDMYQSVKTRAIMNCTLYQKIFLKSVLGVFRRKGVEEAVFQEVYEVFSSLCQFQGLFSPPCGSVLQLCVELGGTRILLVEQGPPTLHTHIRLNCSQDDVVFALKESS